MQGGGVMAAHLGAQLHTYGVRQCRQGAQA